jgi:hypothetical protein
VRRLKFGSAFAAFKKGRRSLWFRYFRLPR